MLESPPVFGKTTSLEISFAEASKFLMDEPFLKKSPELKFLIIIYSNKLLSILDASTYNFITMLVLLSLSRNI